MKTMYKEEQASVPSAMVNQLAKTCGDSSGSTTSALRLEAGK